MAETVTRTLRKQKQMVHRELVAIPPEHIDELSEILEPWIAQALAYADGSPVTPEKLLEGVRTGRALVLAVVHDAGTLEESIEAVAVVQLLEVPEVLAGEPGLTTLHVATLTGRHMHAWLADLLIPSLEVLAREQGAAFLSCTGRLGWLKILGNLGWVEMPHADTAQHTPNVNATMVRTVLCLSANQSQMPAQGREFSRSRSLSSRTSGGEVAH